MPKYIKKKLRVPFHSSSANSEVCVIQDFFSMYILYMTFSVAILKKTKKKKQFYTETFTQNEFYEDF